MKKSTILAGLLLLSYCFGNARLQFTAQVKPASSFTINNDYYVRDSACLDFNRKKDYTDAHDVLLASWPNLRITEAGLNTPATTPYPCINGHPQAGTAVVPLLLHAGGQRKVVGLIPEAAQQGAWLSKISCANFFL